VIVEHFVCEFFKQLSIPLNYHFLGLGTTPGIRKEFSFESFKDEFVVGLAAKNLNHYTNELLINLFQQRNSLLITPWYSGFKS